MWHLLTCLVVIVVSMIGITVCSSRQGKIGAELHKSTCSQRDRHKARKMKVTHTKNAVVATTLTKVLPISVEPAAANENNFTN